MKLVYVLLAVGVFMLFSCSSTSLANEENISSKFLAHLNLRIGKKYMVFVEGKTWDFYLERKSSELVGVMPSPKKPFSGVVGLRYYLVTKDSVYSNKLLCRLYMVNLTDKKLDCFLTTLPQEKVDDSRVAELMKDVEAAVDTQKKPSITTNGREI